MKLIMGNRKTNRRDALKAVLRYGAAAVFWAGGFWLTQRQSDGSGQDSFCGTSGGSCSNCGMFANCGLPRALSQKNEMQKQNQ